MLWFFKTILITCICILSAHCYVRGRDMCSPDEIELVTERSSRARRRMLVRKRQRDQENKRRVHPSKMWNKRRSKRNHWHWFHLCGRWWCVSLSFTISMRRACAWSVSMSVCVYGCVRANETERQIINISLFFDNFSLCVPVAAHNLVSFLVLFV